jgi:hypothetical protein
MIKNDQEETADDVQASKRAEAEKWQKAFEEEVAKLDAERLKTLKNNLAAIIDKLTKASKPRTYVIDKNLKPSFELAEPGTKTKEAASAAFLESGGSIHRQGSIGRLMKERRQRQQDWNHREKTGEELKTMVEVKENLESRRKAKQDLEILTQHRVISRTKAVRNPGWWEVGGEGTQFTWSWEKEGQDMALIVLMYRPSVIVEAYWIASRKKCKMLIHRSLHKKNRRDTSENFRADFVGRYNAGRVAAGCDALPGTVADYWDAAGYAHATCGYAQANEWTRFNFECWVKRAACGSWNGATEETDAQIAIVHAAGPTHLHQEVGGATYELAHHAYETDYQILLDQLNAVNHLWGTLKSCQIHTAFKLPSGDGGWRQVRQRTILLGAYINDIIVTNSYTYAEDLRFGFTGSLMSDKITEVVNKVNAGQYDWEEGEPGHRISDVKYASLGIRNGIYGHERRIGYEFRTCQFLGCNKLNVLESMVAALESIDGTGAGSMTFPGYAAVTLNDLAAHSGARLITRAGFEAIFPNVAGNEFTSFHEALIRGIGANCVNDRCPWNTDLATTRATVIGEEGCSDGKESRWPFIPSVSYEDTYTCGDLADHMMARYAQCYNSGLNTLNGGALAVDIAQFWNRIDPVIADGTHATFFTRMASDVIHNACKDLRNILKNPAVAQIDATFM